MQSWDIRGWRCRFCSLTTEHLGIGQRLSIMEAPNRLTVMDLVSIFLIIAIAADNILLLYNTYELAPAVMPSTLQSPGEKMRQNPLELTVEKSLSSLSSTGTFPVFPSFWLVLGSRMEQKVLVTFTWQPCIVLPKNAHRRWAYRKASLAMLVTSITTCGSFYANMLSIVNLVRRDKQPFRLKVGGFVHLGI